MARITGIGGVFFRSADPAATIAWYRDHLGIEPEVDHPCAELRWSDGGSTVWAPFPADTGYFGDAGQPFMVDYRVDDLAGVLDRLRAAGVDVDDRVEELPNGSFGWAIDCDGRRIELWQPAPGH